jgi:diguanylate cyclase (GGDEF)-like protein/PAS domain S-box-containing protein
MYEPAVPVCPRRCSLTLGGIATPETIVIHGTYHYGLVVLSVALAMFSAYAALDLAGRVTAARGGVRALWLAGGAVAMGLGIWAMHYIGMLALTLPIPVLYHYPTVLVSLLAAIAASAVALFTVSRERMGVKQEIVGSLAMGGGIAAMHYIGMAAMRMPAMMEYRWDRVALSVVLAVGISLVALILTFRVRGDQRTSPRKVASTVVMGSAIPIMHYTGMWAVTFHGSDVPFSTAHLVEVSRLGVEVISSTVFFVLILAIATAFLDRMLTTQKEALGAAHDNVSHFRGLAEAIPEIVFTASPDGLTDYCNKRWYETTQLTEEQTLGRGWSQAIHPDDLPVCSKAWDYAIQTGTILQTEYRLRDAEKNYRWHLVRATPVRDSTGAIIKWFGTSTDIEDQKHNQQILEDQIRDRTLELADANTRLQEEMWERELARKELDSQNDRMMMELTERSQRATLLAKMGELLQSCISNEEAFAAALGFAPRIFPVTRGAVVLLNPTRNLAEVIGAWAECKLPMTEFEPHACWALRTGHPHLVLAGDPTAPCAHALGVKNTYLCIPILAQGEALGFLHFQTTDEVPTVAESELSFKTTFAGQLGLSIANIRLRDALRTQSIRDPLTGLYNRRYLEETLDREIRRAARAEQSLGILMLDLDHFKKFNDTHGHEAGDSVLREAADFLTRSIRIEDTVCRFGGEEFVIILPTASLEAATMRAERIREQLRNVTVLHQGQSLGRITVSVGVAAFPMHGTLAKHLLAAADAALYRAKREGRDRVVSAEPLPATEVQVAAVGQTTTAS